METGLAAVVVERDAAAAGLVSLERAEKGDDGKFE